MPKIFENFRKIQMRLFWLIFKHCVDNTEVATMKMKSFSRCSQQLFIERGVSRANFFQPYLTIEQLPSDPMVIVVEAPASGR